MFTVITVDKRERLSVIHTHLDGPQWFRLSIFLTSGGEIHQGF